MDIRQVIDTYDEEYAKFYNQKFILNERSREAVEFELKTIGRLLDGGGEWLDVACGTGYYLSRFPGVPRAGLDISPAMLDLARQANPDAVFMELGDFRHPYPEWKGRWALVTCTWYSYCLVESMAEVERLIENLASWTSNRGTCFLPMCDPERLTEGVRLPYLTPEAAIYGGKLLITGVIWTWIEESGKQHRNILAPHVDHMVELFREHFDSVEVINYVLSGRPSTESERKGIVARVKK